MKTDWESVVTRCKGRWMVGGSALMEVEETDLSKAIEGDGSRELKLLALVGQALQVCFHPESRTDLKVKPVLPELDLPTLSAERRHLFQRSLAHITSTREDILPLVRLVVSRGYAVHPSDWFPTSNFQDLPEVYLPWVDWLENDSPPSEADELTEETWSDFPPSNRRRLLRELRKNDPPLALSLISEKAPHEPAEERRKLVEILGTSLSESDAGFLESLMTDRSIKVRTLARLYLQRLGKKSGGNEYLAELLDFLTWKKGGAIRSASLSPKDLKTRAQKSRRAELFQNHSLHDVSSAFELDELSLIESWKPSAKEDGATDDFCLMVANTGAEEAALALANRFVPDSSLCGVDAASALCSRLSPSEREELAAKCLEGNGSSNYESLVSRALLCAGDSCGFLPYSRLAKSAEYREMVKSVRGSTEKDEKKANAANRKVDHYIGPFSLLADSDAAGRIVVELNKAGLADYDPRLQLLNLNAALS